MMLSSYGNCMSQRFGRRFQYIPILKQVCRKLVPYSPVIMSLCASFGLRKVK